MGGRGSFLSPADFLYSLIFVLWYRLSTCFGDILRNRLFLFSVELFAAWISRFLFLCCFDAAMSLRHLSVACLCLALTLMATELAADFRELGALGSHLWLFAGVETNVYCIPCSVVRKCTSLVSLSLWCGVAVLSRCCFLLRFPRCPLCLLVILTFAAPIQALGIP